MKQLLAAMAVLFTATTLPAQGNEHSRFIQEGTFAQASVGVGAGGLNLQVTSGRDPNDPTNTATITFLIYTFLQFGADGNSSTLTQVFAPIPNSSFTGQNTQRMVLDVDTSQFDPSNSTVSTCTTTFRPVLNVACTDTAPTGIIHLEFKENGLQRGRLLNINEETIEGPLTIRHHGRADGSSANVEGSYLGVPVVDIGGSSVGLNHDAFWSVTKNL
jgi:hypothetical protein